MDPSRRGRRGRRGTGRDVRRVRQAFAGGAAAALGHLSKKRAQGCLILRSLRRCPRAAPKRSTAWRTR
ncbi:MAG: hypothetical protein LBB49_06705, partial [Gracilibacteraceae bacterium]|nr:hypothetical protein [Gracilibacteraceae bacterium]